MTVDYKKLGERIRKIRKEKNLTQEYLAEQTNLTHVQIGNIEKARSKPSIDSLVSISNVLQTSIDELLFGCIIFSKDKYYNDYIAIISDCNDNEKQIIIENALSLKDLLKKYPNTDK